ncbi:MAG: hypothetical protein IJK41_11105 [Muribaculaceae bacterium]|nr:hypothetical protein [Muribaculaceae bacterium]
MAKTINDEFMQQVATEQAWQKLAEEYAWTEDLLEKYADKLDWKLISTNRVIRWTIPMLKKFSRKLNWEEVSERIDNDWFTEAHIEALKDKWDWSVLVRNYQLSEKLIDKYIDYIDWPSLIGAEGYYCGLPRDDSFDAVSFYEKYKEHISMSTFQKSDLWDKIVEQRRKELMAEIMS